MPLKNISEKAVLTCKDHTVSGKEFDLRRVEKYDLLVTHPRPVDNELGNFYKSEDYISHTDSKKTLLEKIYQGVKSYMLRKKMNWIEVEKSGRGSLLDIGAGTGDFIMEAKKRGWEVSGVEPNPDARERAKAKGVKLLPDSSGLPSNSFDVISLWHVLEHVPDLEKQLSELTRLLKKDGLLIIAVPNFKSYDAKKYGSFWAAYDVPRHLYHFSRKSIEKIFSEHSFYLFKTEPLKFDAFYVSLLSEKISGKTYNPIKAIFTGALSNWKAKSSGEYSSLAYFLRKADQK